MPKTADRVQDSSTTTGVGNFTLSGTPSSGYQAFGTVFSTGDVIYYAIVQTSSTEWEVGVGTMLSSTSFSRNIILDGSSGPGTLVNFTGNTVVFNTQPARDVKRGSWGLSISRMNNLFLP